MAGCESRQRALDSLVWWGTPLRTVGVVLRGGGDDDGEAVAVGVEEVDLGGTFGVWMGGASPGSQVREGPVVRDPEEQLDGHAAGEGGMGPAVGVADKGGHEAALEIGQVPGFAGVDPQVGLQGPEEAFDEGDRAVLVEEPAARGRRWSGRRDGLRPRGASCRRSAA